MKLGWLLVILILATPPSSAAPDPTQPDKEKYDHTLTMFGGRFLPYGIYGVRDVYPTWGGRYSHTIWGIQPEYTATFINSKGVCGCIPFFFVPLRQNVFYVLLRALHTRILQVGPLLWQRQLGCRAVPTARP